MESTVTIPELQANASQVVRRAQKNGAVPVARRGRTVAFLVSRERMEAILETIEVRSDRKAMKAIRNYEAGKLVLKKFDLNEI
jgi:prevent-host-death family protein